MPYNKTDWKNGDVITANRLNKIEDCLENLDNTFPEQGTNRQVVGFSSIGDLIPITLGWMQLSDLNAPPPFNSGVLSATTFQPNGIATFYFQEINSDIDANAKERTIPMYGTNGVLKVGNAVNDLDAINKGQLTTFVTNAINQAELGADNPEIDLSIYALKSDLNGLVNENQLISLQNQINELVQLSGLKIKTYSTTSNSGRWEVDYSDMNLTEIIAVIPEGLSGDNTTNSGSIALLESKTLTQAKGHCKSVIGGGLAVAMELANLSDRTIDVTIIGK